MEEPGVVIVEDRQGGSAAPFDESLFESDTQATTRTRVTKKKGKKKTTRRKRVA